MKERIIDVMLSLFKPIFHIFMILDGRERESSDIILVLINLSYSHGIRQERGGEDFSPVMLDLSI